MYSKEILELQKHLEELISLHAKLETCLKQDIEFFKTNDLQSIEKSNAEKEKLHQFISEELSYFDANKSLASFSGNHVEKIEQYGDTLSDTQAQQKLKDLLALEKNILERVFAQVQINSLIIDSNLEFSKNLIHQIVNHTVEKQTETYDKSANIR